MPARPTPQNTDLIFAVLGCYTCNGLGEALASTDPIRGASARPFDVIIVGGGSFGPIFAQHPMYRDPRRRILVLEAGALVLAEHVQNLPMLALNVPGRISVDPGVTRNEVWGPPWRTDVLHGFPGPAYCLVVYFRGWSPQLFESELPADAWPATVIAELNGRSDGSIGYFRQGAEQIGTNATNDFILGPMHAALRTQLRQAIDNQQVTGAIPLAQLPLHRIVAVETNRGTVPVPAEAAVIIALSTVESARIAILSLPGSPGTDRMGADLMAHPRSNLTIRLPHAAIAGLNPAVQELPVSALFVKGRRTIERGPLRTTSIAGRPWHGSPLEPTGALSGGLTAMHMHSAHSAKTSSKNLDFTVGSSRLQEVHRQLRLYTDNHHSGVIGRVFHATPGRRTAVSFSRRPADARPDAARTRDVLHFGSYNYSGLNGHPRVVAAAMRALQRYGTTSSGVRLLNGTCDLHLELEHRLARFLGFEDCVTYSSGFVANVSVLAGLCGEGDVVLSDMLNHQSIVDGLKLSGAEIRPFRHRSESSIEAILSRLPRERRKFIVTDGVFSMDGDVADLPAIVELAEHHNAFVIVDDAHATAVIGPNGRGTIANFALEGRVDVLTGSLSKGLPGIGGFAAGSKATMDLLRFGSNGYVFSAALPPPVVAGLIEALCILEEQPEIQDRLHYNERYLRDGIRRLGLDCMNSESAIIPVLMPTYEKTMALTHALHLEGLYVNPVGPPAVSKKRTRLRVNASANLEQEDLDHFLDALERTSRKLGIEDAFAHRGQGLASGCSGA